MAGFHAHSFNTRELCSLCPLTVGQSGYVQIRHCHERSIVHEHVRERFTAVRDIPPKVKAMSFRAEFHMISFLEFKALVSPF